MLSLWLTLSPWAGLWWDLVLELEETGLGCSWSCEHAYHDSPEPSFDLAQPTWIFTRCWDHYAPTRALDQFFPYYCYRKRPVEDLVLRVDELFLSDWPENCIGGYRCMERCRLVVSKLEIEEFFSGLSAPCGRIVFGLLLCDWLLFSLIFKLVTFSQSESYVHSVGIKPMSMLKNYIWRKKSPSLCAYNF